MWILFIGNMGNPVITRLGINQFWYKHWYSDKLFSNNLHQDKSFELLIKLYLDYGLTFQSNPLVHEYWYKPSFKSIRTLNSSQNMNFYRRFFYTNESLDIDHSYLIRNKTGEYFPMRTWLFKYLNWVILSVQWFKPIKKKLSRGASYEVWSSHTNTIHEFSKQKHFNPSSNRLKFLMYIYLMKYSKINKEYLF